MVVPVILFYRTGHEGVVQLVAFSSWKAKIILYFAMGENHRGELLQQFGKHTTRKGYMLIKLQIYENVLKEPPVRLRLYNKTNLNS
ncbi:hypothetical protein BKP37_02155 [Anaerobacillus alkalilacustris]|uniref:Uncharacterized protein n=1 Tax=Anaerobacillus alkalilacustris TaxID=393763 RepID=A0A1S2LYM8_9BACI|nr:hypothetical protein BKP37_02155 [Anaerobacillus alkalilacustris]